MVKILLLEAGTVTLWPHMFKSDVKLRQTNKLVKMCKIDVFQKLKRTSISWIGNERMLLKKEYVKFQKLTHWSLIDGELIKMIII